MRRLMGVLFLVALALGAACNRARPIGVSSSGHGGALGSGAHPPPTEQSVGAAEVAGAEIRIGDPKSFENLTVFPILSKRQVDPGPLRTLASALADGSAAVRERGAEDGSGHDAATVAQLVIENRGPTPIYVLAGTVVKGGKQDRQIGQDFVIPGKKTARVDAFCVEQGRWNAAREGADTGGEFAHAGVLATSKVRAAGQYKSDQSQVWAEVAKVNEKNQKEAGTGTLFATLDDEEIKKRTSRLAEQARGHLAGGDRPNDVVGIAYAVDGHIRGVRWFAHKNVFGLFEAMLVESAALEAVTAQSGAPPKPAPPMKPDEVTAFMAKVDRAADEEQKETEGNVNRYKYAADAASSEVFLPASPGKPKAKPIGKDYSAY
jgi:hypothetical protein